MKLYDFIIVGTGIGGSTIGFELAKAGFKVLFLEKGISSINSKKLIRGEYSETLMFQKNSFNDKNILHQTGRCTDSIYSKSDNKSFIPFIGKGGGGSSSLYGAVLERFKEEDFTSELWPISYSELAPYYDKAESLFQVNQSEFTISNENLSAWNILKDNGLHPYKLPLAINKNNFHDHSKCKDNCQSILCSHNNKNDAESVSLVPAVKQFNAELIDECEVVRFVWKNNKINSVECKIKNETKYFHANQFILASGALFSPALLLKSNNLANSSGLVGKYLMRHMVDLYTVKLKGSNASLKSQKQIGFNDFYSINGEKFGTVQSFGNLPPVEVILLELLQKLPSFLQNTFKKLIGTFKPLLSSFFSKIFKDQLIFASIMEDSPSIDNSISIEENSQNIVMNYKPTIKDSEKVKIFREKVVRSFSPLKVNVIESALDNKRIAHVCGTLRFGNDPSKSVLNKNNRAHDIENLYVVDSSFFPTSGGINPSLTIAANALRVADQIKENL